MSGLTHPFVFQVANNYFAHFFAPQNLRKLNKNVVFVIDISTSMEGQKVKQVNGGSKQPSGSFFNPIAHPKLVLPPGTGFGTSAPSQRQGNITENPSGQGLWNQPLLTVISEQVYSLLLDGKNRSKVTGPTGPVGFTSGGGLWR